MNSGNSAGAGQVSSTALDLSSGAGGRHQTTIDANDATNLRSIGLAYLLPPTDGDLGLPILTSTNTNNGEPDSRDSITVHAAGRGNPWINLSDGRQVPTGYTGAAGLRQVLDQNLARPLALASADFDEDGVPDLIGGYAGPGGGLITLHRGNVDSIYPNAPEGRQRKANGTHTDSPLLSPAHVFAMAEAADFVGTGDFDADSHWDVVAAARGGNALWLLSGDGRGGFGAPRRIDLPGWVTTLVTGEINRADGLTDLVVGVVAADGPKALVFESPDGALRGKPEAYGLPAEATALALGHLDGDYTMDLAVGAGSDLIVVYGRDRKLSLDEIRQAEVPKAKIWQRSFPFVIKSAAIGDFTGDHRTGLSLLSGDGAVYVLSGGKATGKKKKGSDRVEKWESEVLARGPWPQATQLVCVRVSSIPGDNLAVVDSANHKLHIIVGSAEGRADRRLQASGTQLVSLDVDGELTDFLSIEFQETGFLVHRFYNLALNRAYGLPRYFEFLRDTQAIGSGVVVGQPGAEALLEANKVAYANEFASRDEYTALYPLTQAPAQYVDALYARAGITPTAAERQAAIDEFSNPTGARARVLRRVAENQTLRNRESNRAFVLAQYFGYLRRNPNDPPDTDYAGYNFWLGKLNQFNGNFVDAEMVKSFIISGEYRRRFGP